MVCMLWVTSCQTDRIYIKLFLFVTIATLNEPIAIQNPAFERLDKEEEKLDQGAKDESDSGDSASDVSDEKTDIPRTLI